MEKRKRITVFGKKREGKDHLEGLHVDGKIIILKRSRGESHYLDAHGTGKEPVTGLVKNGNGN